MPKRHVLHRSNVSFWVVHPRTPQILEAAAHSVELSGHALRHSWTVWERYGNMVSSTVSFVLRELQETAPPRDGDLGLMLAFVLRARR